MTVLAVSAVLPVSVVTATPLKLNPPFLRNGAEYGFGEYGFQTPNSVSFSGLTEFRGANSVSSFQPIICV